ncbi:MAG: hypothetical protein M1839_001651 [Geoglossum umbratile]|nr:MAG: hypothetical protein M1839_001651 [Geoglossum umbratile]
MSSLQTQPIMAEEYRYNYEPRVFSSVGCYFFNPDQKVEEEMIPGYNKDEYYPMKIGQIVNHRYQVVSKLGFSAASTVWLCRDLMEGSYWTLKVNISTIGYNAELQASEYLEGTNTRLRGQGYVRCVIDSFKLQGHYGEHDAFIMVPLGISLRTHQQWQRHRVFNRQHTLNLLEDVLSALFFLHEVDVIHTDIHMGNLLYALTDRFAFSRAEDAEIHEPSSRKRDGDRIVYVSRHVPGSAERLMVCDLGEARLGLEHSGAAMLLQHRAPEVILGMKWGKPVDCWSVGLLAWDLTQPRGLFRIYHESEEDNDAQHLAVMHALLGPPPPEFLARSEETRKYWDADGTWVGPITIPDRTFESLAVNLEGEDKDLLVDMVRSLLRWVPEDRLTIQQANCHDFLQMRL